MSKNSDLKWKKRVIGVLKTAKGVLKNSPNNGSHIATIDERISKVAKS